MSQNYKIKKYIEKISNPNVTREKRYYYENKIKFYQNFIIGGQQNKLEEAIKKFKETADVELGKDSPDSIMWKPDSGLIYYYADGRESDWFETPASRNLWNIMESMILEIQENNMMYKYIDLTKYKKTAYISVPNPQLPPSNINFQTMYEEEHKEKIRLIHENEKLNRENMRLIEENERIKKELEKEKKNLLMHQVNWPK
jgi:hypothetical protein